MLRLRSRVNEKGSRVLVLGRGVPILRCDLVDPGEDYAGYLFIGPISSIIGF